MIYKNSLHPKTLHLQNLHLLTIESTHSHCSVQSIQSTRSFYSVQRLHNNSSTTACVPECQTACISIVCRPANPCTNALLCFDLHNTIRDHLHHIAERTSSNLSCFDLSLKWVEPPTVMGRNRGTDFSLRLSYTAAPRPPSVSICIYLPSERTFT